MIEEEACQEQHHRHMRFQWQVAVTRRWTAFVVVGVRRRAADQQALQRDHSKAEPSRKCRFSFVIKSQ